MYQDRVSLYVRCSITYHINYFLFIDVWYVWEIFVLAIPSDFYHACIYITRNVLTIGYFVRLHVHHAWSLLMQPSYPRFIHQNNVFRFIVGKFHTTRCCHYHKWIWQTWTLKKRWNHTHVYIVHVTIYSFPMPFICVKTCCWLCFSFYLLHSLTTAYIKRSKLLWILVKVSEVIRLLNLNLPACFVNS